MREGRIVQRNEKEKILYSKAAKKRMDRRKVND